MKVGDKLYCIKNYLTFSKGEFVIIADINTNNNRKLYTINKEGVNYSTSPAIYDIYLSEHFITGQQARKIKLKKLNKIERKKL